MHPALEEEADLVATLVHDLALAVESAVMKHGKAIIDMQFFQERMANAAIDIFMATAVLSRTTWEIERRRRGRGAGADRLRARLRADGLSPSATQHSRTPAKSGRAAQIDRRAVARKRRARAGVADRRVAIARMGSSSY